MYGLYTAILLSSIFMIFMEFLGLPFFIKVLQVPKHYLMPVIAILCSIGAFGVSNRVFNIWVVFFIGLAAFILQKLDIPLAPVILGFILGPIFETNFRRAEQYMAASNAELFQHPIAIVFMLVTFAVLILNMKSNHKIAKAEKNKNDEKEKKL